MFTMDMRTVMNTQGLIYLVCFIVMLFLWVQARHNYRGLAFWVGSFALGSIGSILIGFREIIPDWASIPLANSMVVGSFILLFLGLHRFLGKKILKIYNAILLVGFIIFVYVHCYYTYVVSDLLARVVNVSAGILLFSFLSFCLLSWGTKPEVKRHSSLVRLAFILIALILLARIAGVGLLHTNDFMASGLYDTAIVLLYSILIIFLAVTLILMVNRLSIDEAMRAEELVRVADIRFQGLFNFMSSGVAVYEANDNGEDFIFRDFNPSAEKIEKVSRTDILGKRVTEVFPGVKEFGVFEVFQRVWQTGKPEYFPQHIYTDEKNPGSWRENWVFKLLSGEIVAVYNDITERKLAEEEIALKAQLLDNANDSIYLYNFDDGAFIYANEMTCKSLGYSREELMNMKFHQLIPPEYAQYRSENRQALQEKGYHSFESANFRKDGSIIPLEIRLRLIVHDNKRYVLVIARDISERKQAEHNLKESELKYRRIVETASEGVISVGTDERITFINNRIGDMLGYNTDEIIGQPLIKFIFEEDLADHKERRKELRKRISLQLERRFKRKDGREIWVSISSTSVKDKSGQFAGTFGLWTDITDRRRLEEERQRADKLDSVGLLAGGIAHDFNNILTAILGNISLAKMDTKPDSDIYDRLEEAEKASLRATALTKQLLTFSKGGAPVKKLATLSGVLEDTANFALRGSNMKCHVSVPADLWHAEVDIGQVSQVINNLVINAQQAMPTGGTIEVRAENITLAEEQTLGKRLPLAKGNYIRISVIDHGTGIPEEHLGKIFDPFFTTKQKGSGLGLATSFSIINNHGGHIGVESELGKGSAFYVYLPASTETATEAKKEKTERTPAVKARILVMDDEETVREVAGRILKHIGYEDVAVAADGAAAIKLYQEAMKAGKPFSAVILDLTIPGGMGGKEVIRKLLKIDPEVKAIVSSGYSSELDITEYKGYGFKGAVGKPYTIEQLRQAMQELLG